jgi:hypothetical protein
MFMDTFNKYIKDVFSLDFNDLIIKIKEMKQIKEFSDRFFVGYRILELLNDIYIKNKNMVSQEINYKFQSYIIIKDNNSMIRFSELLFKFILINDFLLNKNIYFDKFGFLLIKIDNLFFDFSSDNIKLIDEIYYFDKNYNFMLNQSISLGNYRDSLFEATEVDLLAHLVMGSLYPNLSINMPNYFETQEIMLESFKNKNTKNHNYHCSLLLYNIYNKKTFDEMYQAAYKSSFSCNNHYLAKIYYGIIFNMPLESTSEAVDLYTNYSTFMINNGESLSEKTKIVIINYILYLSALINNNNEIADKAYERIERLNIDTKLEITKMNKNEASLTLQYIKSFYRMFKIKKTNSFISFLVKLLKSAYEEELKQKNNTSEEICLLLNKSPISILLGEIFEKDSYLVVQIMDKLNKSPRGKKRVIEDSSRMKKKHIPRVHKKETSQKSGVLKSKRATSLIKKR